MTGVTADEFNVFPDDRVRLSDEQRERVIEALRAGAVEGRLSHDTFVHRMELALAAREESQLAVLTVDLPPADGRRLSGRLLRTVRRVSAFTVRLRGAWRTEKLPPLVLPDPGPWLLPLRIGRDVGNTLRLGDGSASRVHAELRWQTTGWLLCDLGSMNGTYVNGRRVIGPVPVRVGDQVRFGRVSFRLAAAGDD